MYSGWSQPNGTRPYSLHERSTSYSNDPPRSHDYLKTVTQPPRPLEPRPMLHSSFSEPSAVPKVQETYCYHDSAPAEYPVGGRSLPGLRDILTSDSYPPTSNSYGVAWSSAGGPQTGHRNGEDYNPPAALHPPMVLYPPTTLNERQSASDHRYEGSTHEFNRPVVLSPLSPYAGYPDTRRDLASGRGEGFNHASGTSSLTNGVSSPYCATANEGISYRSEATASYRTSRTGPSVPGAESHGKYLGMEDVPGDGKFHVYEDGFRIPTQVDGEQVNPAWGLTKANKPRKRLALACLDCREKKVKCEPGTSSCMQCEKAMRLCRRAPEKSSQAESAMNTLWVAGSPVRRVASATDQTSHRREGDSESMSKRRTRADPSPPQGPNKRQRSPSPRPSYAPDTVARGRDEVGAAGPSIHDVSHKGPLMWENDPYAVEPEITCQLLELYFTHINNATYCIFPQKHFLAFLKEYDRKCQNEKMTLYAMLAAASIFAGDELSGFGKQCAQIAGDAIASQVGRFTIASAVTKTLLAVYYSSRGAEELAWDYIGQAIRTVTFMNFNTETGCMDESIHRGQARYEFSFSPEQIAECKRRTFWSAFLQDRDSGSTMCAIKPEDVFVRLPCSDDFYERSIPSDAPYFRNGAIDPDTASLTSISRLPPMAWLVLVATVWGDVIDSVFRASYRPSAGYQEAYESFYSETQARLQDWLTQLPGNLQYSVENLERSIRHNYVGILISMHILRHLSLVHLNRYMRHGLMSESLGRNVRTANYHGHQILQIMTALHVARTEIPALTENRIDASAFSTPLVGDAILSAVDIVSAGGLDSNLKATLGEIDGGLGCLQELSRYWNSAGGQKSACEKRFYQLKNITLSPNHAKSGCWLGRKWGIKSSLEQEFGSENDCIYGLGEREADEAMQKYFDAFQEA